MIRTETYMLGEREFTRTWSDANRFVVRNGVEYSEANDPSEFGRVYTEGELMPPEDIAAQAEEVLNILMGVSE
jgi:hypothetical protein